MDNYVFIGTNGKVRAVEVGDRSIRTVWTEELKGMGYETVSLFFVSGTTPNNNTKEMINPLSSSSHLHSSSPSSSPPGPSSSLSFSSSSSLSFSTSSSSDRLFGATSGFVFRMDPHSGRILWKTKPAAQNGMMTSNPMTVRYSADYKLVISAAKGAVTALHAENGSIVWEYIIDEFATGSAFTLWERAGMLVIGNMGKLIALQIAVGKLIWQNALPGKGYASISLSAYPVVPPGFVHDTLFVGTAGYILALDMKTGTCKRETNLAGTGFKPVALLLDNKTDIILCATSGELRCFRGEAMQPLWKSNLKGMSYSFGHSLLFPNDTDVVIAMNGKVSLINRGTGLTEWITSGCGSGMTSAALMKDPNLIAVAANGYLYILDKSDGQIIMKDGLSGMGYGTFSLSTNVFNTDYNSTTLPHYIMEERRSST